MKRFISYFVVLILICIPVVNFADENTDFFIENDVLMRYNGNDNNIVIPYGVKEICDTSPTRFALVFMSSRGPEGAFIGNKTVKSIVIPSSVTFIGGWAFAYCENLESVTIPEGVKQIGENAFSGCSKLKTINIPASVETIHASILGGYSLPEVIVDENNKNYSSENGILFDKLKTKLINYPDYEGAYTIPDTVTTIGFGAFDGCNGLTEINIPDTVTEIERYAFRNCRSLKSLTLPDTITKIPDYMATYAMSLTSVKISDNVTDIGMQAFGWCKNLPEFNFPENLKTIGAEAFQGCKAFTYVDIPKGVTDIGMGAFSYQDNLLFAGIPDSVSSLNWTFGDCVNLKAVSIPKTVSEIKDALFFTNDKLTVYCDEPSAAYEYARDKNLMTLPIISVNYNNSSLSFDQPPIIKDDLTLVPIRAISEAFDAEVSWVGSIQRVEIIYADKNISLKINDINAVVNGEAVILDTAPVILNGRTLVPLRFISENFGANVIWHEETKTIDINNFDNSWEYIKNKAELIVGLEDTFVPMGFRNEDGELIGFDIDLAKAVAEKLGIKLKFQPIEWSAKELELEAKRIDCIWNGMSVTLSRLDNLSATEPYIKTRAVFMGENADEITGLDDLKGKKIGLLKNSYEEEVLKDCDEYKNLESNIIFVDSSEELTEELKSGRIDLIFTDEILGLYKLHDYDMKTSEFSLNTDYYAAFFRKGEIELSDMVNNAINDLIVSGEAAVISEKWFGRDLLLGQSSELILN